MSLIPVDADADYRAHLAQRESSGGRNLQSPTSSAQGLYQFTAPTWRRLMQNYPALKLTEDGRMDPAQQNRALTAFNSENDSVLKGLGLEPNGPNRYSLHFFGAGNGQDFLTAYKQDPTQIAAAVVPPNVSAANRSVFYAGARPKTVGEVYGEFARSFATPVPPPTPIKATTVEDLTAESGTPLPPPPPPSMAAGLSPQDDTAGMLALLPMLSQMASRRSPSLMALAASIGGYR